jgi:hypothetical protein
MRAVDLAADLDRTRDPHLETFSLTVETERKVAK